MGEDEVGLTMHHLPTNYDNSSAPENVPEISNQGEVVYNADWGHDGIFWGHMMGASNHNPCVKFTQDIKRTNMQLFQLFFFGFFI